ncbi:unnamed protein product, partial [Meganyctiphanes norvegica]
MHAYGLLPSISYYKVSHNYVVYIIINRIRLNINIRSWLALANQALTIKHFHRGHAKSQRHTAKLQGPDLLSFDHSKIIKTLEVHRIFLKALMIFFFAPGESWKNHYNRQCCTVVLRLGSLYRLHTYKYHKSNLSIHGPDPFYLRDMCSDVLRFSNLSIDSIIDYFCAIFHKYTATNSVLYQMATFKLDSVLLRETLKFKHFPYYWSDSPSRSSVRVFKFLSGKLTRVYDESLQHFTELQQQKQQIPNMEFGRRLAVERDAEKGGAVSHLIFDESGHFLLYPTLLGVKVINLLNNRLVRTIGKPENLRMLHLALFQGKVKKHKGVVTMEMEASENKALVSIMADPTLVATAFRKNRFYLFTKRDATDTKSVDTDRDVFNEKPSKEDIIAATEQGGGQRLYESTTIHTSMGDITIKLFPKECPKTVENFCVHVKNGYYNGHIFHRVIKQFMVQTGDPQGTGVGGESIWGGEFEDEFHPSLRHDRPYTVSMANAGANTNGSQFFFTVVPTPWLDNKHTVFGRVIRGMETVQNISAAKTNPKTDKPYDDISIISISLK